MSGRGPTPEYQDGDKPVPADVRARIAAGMTDEEIRVELGIGDVELARLKKALMAEELQSVRHRPVEEVFIDYRIRMLRIANDLQDVNVEARAAKQFTAAMGALKAESTVVDRVIDRGQELGILPRAPKSTTSTVVGGLLLGAMTDRELGESLKTLKTERTRLRRDYGDGPLQELPAPDLYAGDVVEAEEVEKVHVTAPPRQKVR